MEVATKNELLNKFQIDGFCLPSYKISTNTLIKIKKELVKIEDFYTAKPWSQYSHVVMNDTRFMLHDLMFENCSTIHELIHSGEAVQLLKEWTGDELVCISCTYANCKPGYPGIPLHTDYDPYSNNLYRPSNPVAIRVLYYLDDLTAGKAPLWVLPRSHNQLHKSLKPATEFIQPPKGYNEVIRKARDLVILNTKVFHGVGPNNTKTNRRVLAMTYRPRWAAPLHPVVEYDPIKIKNLNSMLQPLFSNLNT
jgi:Phytanoyl-CoA dioxygenase (PhyH)